MGRGSIIYMFLIKINEIHVDVDKYTLRPMDGICQVLQVVTSFVNHLGDLFRAKNRAI